ncbi:hypothetical protein J5N97_018153 [Dioscorea zingiberensis]|uniref:BURP domain-containing protein n=1 Tax=Dioscorea zingiberensis TaxID=325984 RepID=A0A9D5HH31_9LILI|nr:hypothetical protein J5N97_018153 [Dioscorea zingiberensis]
MKGEEKLCATSLESMVDFSMEKLHARDVIALSTTADKVCRSQKYTNRSLNGVQRMKGKRMVVCHAEVYPYAVFYCHATKKTRGYRVRMDGGEDGEVVEAVVACHMDTAGWNKDHIAFEVLKVKPGSVPICHFMRGNHVVWGPMESVE